MEQNQKESLAVKEGELSRFIEALIRVEASEDWRTLKTGLFDGLTKRLENQLFQEANKPVISESTIYRLQGKLEWARAYSDLKKYGERLRNELSNIRQTIHGKEN